MHHHIAAAWLLAVALLVKALVPAGYMVAAQGDTFVIELCSGTTTRTMVMTIPSADDSDGQHDRSAQGKADMPCAFAGLSLTSLAATDPIVLAAALLFVMGLALRPILPRAPLKRRFLRPPLRGPPATL